MDQNFYPPKPQASILCIKPRGKGGAGGGDTMVLWSCLFIDECQSAKNAATSNWLFARLLLAAATHLVTTVEISITRASIRLILERYMTTRLPSVTYPWR